jgi:WXG100 family type VII secretion target
MSTHEMRAGHGTLATAAGFVADAKADLDHQAAALASRLAAAQGRWQGAGGSAFFAVQQTWNDKQRTILAALEEFQSALRGTQARNEASDESASALQNAHLHRLDGIRR